MQIPISQIGILDEPRAFNYENLYLLEKYAMENDKIKPTTVIYINSELMGFGDEKLGTLLMRNFLSTLGDFVNEVSHILLVNGGVKLACEGSDKADILVSLEEAGIEILSCGTCINHFNLSDKVNAGQISNMFAILQVLTSADTIVTP